MKAHPESFRTEPRVSFAQVYLHDRRANAGDSQAVIGLIRALVVAWVLALALAPVSAHELQPGFLELKEADPGRFDVLWKLPSLGASDVRMPIVPVFPERCQQLGESRTDRAGTAWVFAARLECNQVQGLA
jgi:hypothetical protein